MKAKGDKVSTNVCAECKYYICDNSEFRSERYKCSVKYDLDYITGEKTYPKCSEIRGDNNKSCHQFKKQRDKLGIGYTIILVGCVILLLLTIRAIFYSVIS